MSVRRLALTFSAVTSVLAGTALLSCAPALALVKHEYISQITGFVNPTGIAFGPNSALYVTDSGSATVDRFDEAGAPLPFSASEPYVQAGKLTGTPSGPFGGPQAVAVDDATGDVYVLDSGVIDIFSTSGEYISQITEAPPNALVSGPFDDGASGLTVDQATNNLYVTATGWNQGLGNYQEVVDIFSESGKYLSQVYLDSREPFPTGVVVNELTEDIYVGSGRSLGALSCGLEVFGPSGSSLSIWNGAGSLAGTFGSEKFFLGMDQSTGQVYVAESTSNVVDEFGASVSETYEGELTGTPSGPFGSPRAVAVSPTSGDVYVADASGGVVDVFGLGVPVKPLIRNQSFSEADSRTATLNAKVFAGEAPATYHFEYGTTGAYGSETPIVKATGTFSASAELGDLTPDTEYHFRLVVENEAGAESGVDATFTTLPPAIQGLPDGRAYEMVTPIDKENAEVYVPDALSYENEAEGYKTTRLNEAAADGDAVVYQGDPTHDGGAESSGNGLGSAYMATRSSTGGWTQIGIEPPGRRLAEYRGFSIDLSAGVIGSPTENPEMAEPQLPGAKAPVGSYDQKEGGRYKEYFDLQAHSGCRRLRTSFYHRAGPHTIRTGNDFLFR